MRKERESDLKRTVISYLDLHRIFWWPQNTGAARFVGKNGKRRFVKFGKVGSPDLFALCNGVIFGLELKATNGKWAEAQKEFCRGFSAQKGVYVVVKRLEDVMLALEAKVV